MCLRIAKDQEVKIAQEDIVCYKVLKSRDNGLYSPYQQTLYKLGETMSATIGRPEMMKILSIFGVDSNEFKGIEEGLHSYADKESAEQFRTGLIGMTLCVAIIPKGAEYYEGTFDLFQGFKKFAWPSYVSNQLIVKEVL